MGVKFRSLCQSSNEPPLILGIKNYLFRVDWEWPDWTWPYQAWSNWHGLIRCSLFGRGLIGCCLINHIHGIVGHGQFFCGLIGQGLILGVHIPIYWECLGSLL